MYMRQRTRLCVAEVERQRMRLSCPRCGDRMMLMYAEACSQNQRRSAEMRECWSMDKRHAAFSQPAPGLGLLCLMSVGV